jgi:hypothetical protein
MQDIISYIITNKNKIVNDAVDWMATNYPSRTKTPEKCIRDINYVLDAYVTDINSDTSIQIINIGNNFWHNGVRQVKKYKIEIKVHKYIVNKIKENVSKESGDKLQSLLEIFCSILINGPVEVNNTIEEIIGKYQYTRVYDTTAKVNHSIIEKCLQAAWKNTPSKNNFMNYRVIAIGPDRQDLKDAAFKLCIKNECNFDSDLDLDAFIKERYTDQGIEPQFANIKTCSYLLIFTQRIADTLNPWQQYSVDRGRRYEQLDTEEPMRAFKGSAIEVGMFAANFAAMCFENDLDISHTLCTPTDPRAWKEFGIKDPAVMLLMTVGKGKVYRRDHLEDVEKEDFKPDFEKVVQFMK